MRVIVNVERFRTKRADEIRRVREIPVGHRIDADDDQCHKRKRVECPRTGQWYEPHAKEDGETNYSRKVISMGGW